MGLTSRSSDLVESLPHTIYRTSDRIQFGGLRVLMRELPREGWVEVPNGIGHFFLAFRPTEEPGRMVAEIKNANLTHFSDRSLLFDGVQYERIHWNSRRVWY